jgi:hypothetical protein
MGALVRLILVAEYRTDHSGKRRIGEWFDSIGLRLNHSRPNFNEDKAMTDKTKTFTIDIHGDKKTITGTLVDDSHYQCDGYIVDLSGRVAEKDPWYADYYCAAPQYPVIG